jgi:hypothetical protein
MLQSLFYGTLTGIALCLTFGTVFFSLVQNSVDNGYRTGIKIAFGVFVCDIIFVFFAIFGTALLPDIPDFKKWMAAAGVVFLMVLGLNNLVMGQPKIAYPQTRFRQSALLLYDGFFAEWLKSRQFYQLGDHCLLYTYQSALQSEPGNAVFRSKCGGRFSGGKCDCCICAPVEKDIHAACSYDI